jgi:hypothetical protein
MFNASQAGGGFMAGGELLAQPAPDFSTLHHVRVQVLIDV